MQFTTKAIALFSVLSTSVLAADVFAAFLDANGAEIGTTQFDVGDSGCFSVPRASQVSFSQSGSNQRADGPYCLFGFPSGGCPATGTSQQFQDVDVTASTNYQLEQGLNGAMSFKWLNGAC